MKISRRLMTLLIVCGLAFACGGDDGYVLGDGGGNGSGGSEHNNSSSDNNDEPNNDSPNNSTSNNSTSNNTTPNNTSPNNSEPEPATGPLADRHMSQETYYNNYDELRCECFWDELTQPGGDGFDSAQDCKDTLLIDDEEIQEQASCIQSILDDASDVPGGVIDYYECTDQEFSDAQSCVDDLAPDDSCSDLTKDMLQQCRLAPAGNIDNDCEDILSDSDKDWLDDINVSMFIECPF